MFNRVKKAAVGKTGGINLFFDREFQINWRERAFAGATAVALFCAIGAKKIAFFIHSASAVRTSSDNRDKSVIFALFAKSNALNMLGHFYIL